MTISDKNYEKYAKVMILC